MDSDPAAHEAAELEGGVSLSVDERRSDRRWLFFVLVVTMIAIDMAIKTWAETNLNHGEFYAWPWPGVFELRLTFNQGIAFGLAQGKGGLFTPIALLISFGAAWYSWKRPHDSVWLHTSMALLAAGALGNLYDRVQYGYVRDMFATRFIDFPVFNWADVCISLATIILILIWSKDAVDARGSAAAKRKPVEEPAAET